MVDQTQGVPAQPPPNFGGAMGAEVKQAGAKVQAAEQSVVKTIRAKFAELIAEHYIKAILAGLSYAFGHLVGNSTIGHLIAKLF